MWDRLLLAIDQFDSGQAALDFTTGLAAASGADVRVFHARELSKSTRVPPLETAADARFIVDEAVFRLRLASIGAEGRACSAREEQVASRIVDEASQWRCDAIVLGSRRLRGISRLSGWGVRERLLGLVSESIARTWAVCAASPGCTTDLAHRLRTESGMGHRFDP